MNQQEAVRQAKLGNISASIQTLERQLQTGAQSYSVYSNLGALWLQLGNHEACLQHTIKAIKIDPFQYIGYFNRFLCYLSLQNLELAWYEIRKALSCLFVLKGEKQGSIKYLNKAISHCQYNVRAYLARARLYQGKNNKLAENDYDAAAEYQPNYPLIYQQRALFFRRLNRNQQFEDDLHRLAALRQQPSYVHQELKDNQNQQGSIDFKQKIGNCVKQYQNLISNTSENILNRPQKEAEVQNSPLNSIEQEQLLLNSDSLQQKQIGQTLPPQQQTSKLKQPDQEAGQSLSIEQPYIDENTEYLNHQIEKLQDQIRAEGGILPEQGQDNLQLQLSGQNTFYSAQIEQTNQEIKKLTSWPLDQFEAST